MITMDMIPIPNPLVVGRIIEDEAVLVLPSKGQVKVLNGVGARIWSYLNGKRTVREIVGMIHNEYAVDEQVAQEDTRIFLGQLADKEIITFA